MQSSSSKSRIIGVLLVAIGLLTGCSTLRFAYNQAPDLAYWWIDGYADLDDPQSVQVRAALAQWFRWNRKSELPLYADMLARAEMQVLEPATAAQACAWYDELLLRVDAAAEQGVPAMAALAMSITPAQITHIEQKYEKKNREFADDYLQDTPAARLKGAVKVAQDRAELLYGDLEPAPLQRLTTGIAQSPFDPQLWLAERKQRQQDVLQLLRRVRAEAMTAAQAQDAVRAVIKRIVSSSPNEAYRTYQQKLVRYNCALSAQVHNATSPAQRRVAAKRLRGWRDDLRALVAAANG